jgi:Holliday junction resolvase
MSRLLRASQRQENRIAGRLNGQRTPGSGNGFRKNDVRTEDLSLEMKYTGKKQFTLKADDLEQGERHAIMDGRDFAFGIEMNGRNWVIISEDDFVLLRTVMEESSHGA